MEGFRLSPQQKHLWSLQQSLGGQAYRALTAVELRGELRVETLKKSLEQVVGRHEILRTTFHRPPGRKLPFQVVSEEPRFSWQEVELSNLNSEQQKARMEKLFDDQRKQSFDFEQGPLFQASLMKLSRESHVLFILLPALCADSRTLSNLISLISQTYDLGLKASSDAAMQYADFAEWQNELLESNDEQAQKGKAYWPKPGSSFGSWTMCEKRTAGERTFHPDSVPLELDSAVQAKIETVAEQHETSVTALLLACWQAVVWRLGGPSSEHVIFSLRDGRSFEDLQGALGLYGKYAPVNSDCADVSFAEYLRRTSVALKEAGEWEEYLDPDLLSSTGDSVEFEFEERPAQYEAGSLSFKVIEQYVCIAPFKLKLSCVRSGGVIAIELHYDRQLFEPKVVQNYAIYFQRFLSGVLRDPALQVGAVELLTADERYQLLAGSNETEAEFPTNRCVHHLFEEQVAATPQATAVVSGECELTYAVLNSRANQLAHLLRKRGVSPGSRVGLCLERSAEAIVGMLGILKAGGAYVPLNPDHPPARMEVQLNNSEASICISNGNNLESLEKSVQLIDLERDQPLLDHEPTANPHTMTTPDHLAYVIHTSGSTGIPKGVGIRHQSLVNYTHFINKTLENHQHLNFATVSTISADLGNTCIFPSLVSGGCLHIISYDVAMERSLFSKYLAKHPIDVLKIVPSHLNSLLGSQEVGDILPSKYLITGGEALTWDLLDRISQGPRTCKVINHYGPTETTVGSLTFSLEENEVSPYSLTIPIGKPIANTSVYILDARLRPVPVGVAGELYIGGSGVADGYLNQPAETAVTFIPDSFSGEPGRRLYKTGDLVRYLPDGFVEFLGRADYQVKVRGFRVELGEIEAALVEPLGVRQAIAMVRQDASGDARLVAYVVASGINPPSHEDLRKLLKQKLPDYMIPSSFVFLKSFPLTANGKVDRAALPSPDEARPELQRTFVGPRTSVEQQTAEIWAAVLRLNEVGIHDNFFDLGGHSLLATQVISRMRKSFQLEIPLRKLFELPTVATLADWIERAREAETAQLLTELESLTEEQAKRLFESEVSSDRANP